MCCGCNSATHDNTYDDEAFMCCGCNSATHDNYLMIKLSYGLAGACLQMLGGCVRKHLCFSAITGEKVG